MTVPDIAGLVGVACIAAAYAALQARRIDPAKPAFSALNAAGAALVLWSLAYDFNLAAALVEGIWLVTSLWGLVRAISRKGESAGTDPA